MSVSFGEELAGYDRRMEGEGAVGGACDGPGLVIGVAPTGLDFILPAAGTLGVGRKHSGFVLQKKNHWQPYGRK